MEPVSSREGFRREESIRGIYTEQYFPVRGCNFERLCYAGIAGVKTADEISEERSRTEWKVEVTGWKRNQTIMSVWQWRLSVCLCCRYKYSPGFDMRSKNRGELRS